MEQGTGKSDLARRAEVLAKDCAAFAELISQERDCLDVVSEIASLALSNIKYVHIHWEFHAHTNEFNVSVNPGNNSYEIGKSIHLYTESVYFDRNRFKDDATPLQQLLEIEDKLLELIAEAKDKLEVEA